MQGALPAKALPIGVLPAPLMAPGQVSPQEPQVFAVLHRQLYFTREIHRRVRA